MQAGNILNDLAVNTSIKDILANKDFGYSPELTESALMELRNIGLFSNVLVWNKNKDNYISRGRYLSGNAFAYTGYTKSFIEFIIKDRDAARNKPRQAS